MLQQDCVQEPTYIIESKKRCIELGMNPNETIRPKKNMSELKLTQKKEKYKEILEVVKFFSTKILKSLEGTPILIAISDENGYLLDTLGDETIKSTMLQLGIKPGIQFSQDDMGTNVVALTLKQDHPVQLIGTNHFHTILHNSACYGVPFHYTDVNNLLGSICIMTAVILHNPFFLMTLTTVVDAIERELLLRKQNIRLIVMNKAMLSKTRKIQQQKKELEAIIESISDGISIIDDKGRFRLFNKNSIETFFPPKSYMGDVHDWYKESELFYFKGNKIPTINTPASRVLRGEKFSNMMVSAKSPNKLVHLDVSGTPIYDDEGKFALGVICSRDMTDYYKREEILKDKNEEFLVNISHELKTPLNVIYSTIQLFNMYLEKGSLDQNKDSMFKYTNSMMQNCYRLSKLINNIVDLSKIEAGFFKLNLSNKNIVEVVEEIVMSVTDYTDTKGLSIIFDTDIEEKIIACDPEKIERIVLNLISNAIKFSDVGNEIFVIIKDKNEMVEISVKDNGIGIEQNQLDMIFDRFKQVDKSLSRNAEGAGIGLSLVKAIVEMHKGNIYVESERGKGSKFIIEIPTTITMKENKLVNAESQNKTESLQVELSDI